MKPSWPLLQDSVPVWKQIGAAVAICLLSSGSLCAVEPPAATPAQLRHFETHVRPLLVEHCLKCHGADQQKGGLRLDSRGHMLLGGDSGPALVPGKAEESLLVEAVRYESFEMPPSGRLAPEKIDILTAWVNAGAPWPGDDGSIAKRDPAGTFSEEDRSWWAIQPVRQPAVPEPPQTGWGRNEVDAFVGIKLKEHELSPAPEADRRTLIRRLYFDLIGLPPSPQEVQAFVEDPNSDAYERLVDELLERPEYGDHWARHWLDLARYADSDGYRADHYRPQAWRYRDYVVESFNSDKPYDRFVQEQLAGDELFPDDPQALIATGFLRQGIYEYNNRDVRGQWEVILNELTDTTSDVFLGLGLQCARCHDHKFDPLLQQDYFRLRAFFEPILPQDDRPAATPQEMQLYAEQARHYAEITKDLQAKLDELEAEYRVRAEQEAVGRYPDEIQAMVHKPPQDRTPLEEQLSALAWRQVLYEYSNLDGRMKGEKKEQVLALRKQLAEFARHRPSPLPLPMTVSDVGPVAPATLIPKKQIEVAPGFPTILQAQPVEIPAEPGRTSTGRRSVLARWLTSPENPLSARVIVNRVWQYHFGRGLAENSSDFGHLGAPPTHPELLDWLTSQFVQEGWHLKQLHRKLVTSATYRQSSTHPDFRNSQLKDPGNLWHWRAPTRRLDAEQIRDSLLKVTGQLASARGGPGVLPDQPRRSIYTRVMRNSRDPLLDVFDLPQFFSSAPSRDTTTSPVQSLLLINSQTMLRHAELLAGSISRSVSAADPYHEHFIRQLWWQTLGREPRAEEIQQAQRFLEDQAQTIQNSAGMQAVPKTTKTGKMPYRDGQSILLVPEGKHDHLSVDHSEALDLEDFTIEAFFQLRSIYDSGAVRTLVSKRDSDTPGGWSFGVTGKGSRRKPQTLVLQVFGKNAAGKMQEAAIFSDQNVEINKPYFVAVSFRRASGEEPGSATFFLKDLSNDDEPLQVAELPHEIVGGFENKSPLSIGSVRSKDNLFDGLIDDLRISRKALTRPQLLITAERSTPETMGYWQFEPNPGIFQDSSARGLHLSPWESGERTRDPNAAALIDLCHILLNSNEFLYVD